jgi:histone H1/5
MTSVLKKTYLELACEAIAELKERGGSSVPAIKHWMEANFASCDFQSQFLRVALKRGIVNGKLEQVKHSFKLTRAGKKTVEVTFSPKTKVMVAKESGRKVTAMEKSNKRRVVSKVSKGMKKTKKGTKKGSPSPSA